MSVFVNEEERRCLLVHGPKARLNSQQNANPGSSVKIISSPFANHKTSPHVSLTVSVKSLVSKKVSHSVI